MHMHPSHRQTYTEIFQVTESEEAVATHTAELFIT